MVFDNPVEFVPVLIQVFEQSMDLGFEKYKALDELLGMDFAVDHY